jgi:hypothetical protein
MACSLRVAGFPPPRRRELITTKARRAWGGQWPQPRRTSNIERRTSNVEWGRGCCGHRFGLWIRHLRFLSCQDPVQKTSSWLVVVRRRPRKECCAQRPESPGLARDCACPHCLHFVLLSRNFLFSRQETPKWRDATCGAASQCGRSFIRCSMLGVRCSMFALFGCGQRPLYVPRAFVVNPVSSRIPRSSCARRILADSAKAGR